MKYIKESNADRELIKRFSTPQWGGFENQNVVDILIDGQRMLIQAAMRGHINICEYLLNEEKANIDIEMSGPHGESGWTALMYATYQDKIEIVSFLLKNKADIRCKDNYGIDCMHIAEKKNNSLISHILYSIRNDSSCRYKLNLRY